MNNIDDELEKELIILQGESDSIQKKIDSLKSQRLALETDRFILNRLDNNILTDLRWVEEAGVNPHEGTFHILFKINSKEFKIEKKFEKLTIVQKHDTVANVIASAIYHYIKDELTKF